ncbi:hypothetical protein K438DRAFT_1768662 [Mycena galopus ATCC 62051]|nr:hypothetical protein K438DRAFT_1768662 [Mycena galopus ATCC 62051]
MVFSEVFAPLFVIVLAAAVSATPVASPDANASVEIAVFRHSRQTWHSGNVYICPQTSWGGDCTTISAANTCNNLGTWQDEIQSIGPDSGATCTGKGSLPNQKHLLHHQRRRRGSGGIGPVTGLVIAVHSATYYYPNGGLGACNGVVIQNGDMAVAIGQGHWDNGAHCGATMTVTGTNGIDLTQGAMAAMDPNWYTHGVDTVTWSTNY